MMCVTDGGGTAGYFNTYVLEANRITARGSWSLT
jgi:hypothetical protein